MLCAVCHTIKKMTADVHKFLGFTLADECSASRLNHFMPGQKVVVTTGWRNVWAEELLQRRQKVSCSAGKQILTPPSHGLYNTHYTDCNTLTPILLLKNIKIKDSVTLAATAKNVMVLLKHFVTSSLPWCH
jgi:hypothetical protein